MKNLASHQGKIELLSLVDKKYPLNLRHIFKPPARLYVQGDIIEQDNIAIAIVGSRRATSYGLKNAQQLSFRLAARGITIISGLARGVDSAAHRGALAAGGRSIAVLGSGLNVIYPRENKQLATEISQNGALISEFSLDSPPLRQNFPRRNRIISGLSLGVVVVEAAKRSGALITANFALEQGREVFALPGKVDSFTSAGTHDLIKQGAKLVESEQDIIEELQALQYLSSIQPESNEEQSRPRFNLPEAQQQVYDHLSSQSLHIDQIMPKLEFSYGKLQTCLLNLQYKGLVKELPGKFFIKSN